MVGIEINAMQKPNQLKIEKTEFSNYKTEAQPR
jgi:hypothetical protein